MTHLSSSLPDFFFGFVTGGLQRSINNKHKKTTTLKTTTTATIIKILVKVIPTVMKQLKQLQKKIPEKSWSFKRIQTHDFRDNGAVLYQQTSLASSFVVPFQSMWRHHWEFFDYVLSSFMNALESLFWLTT